MTIVFSNTVRSKRSEDRHRMTPIAVLRLIALLSLDPFACLPPTDHTRSLPPSLARALSLPRPPARTHFLPSFKMACLPQPQRVTYVAGGWRAVLLNLLLLRKTVHPQKHCPWMRPRKRAGLLTVCIHVLHHQACVCRRHRPTLVSQHVHKLTGRTIAATAVCADDRHGFFWGRLLVLCCARLANRSPA